MKLEESALGHLVTSEKIQRAYDLGLNANHFKDIVSPNRAIFEFVMKYWTDSGREKAPTAQVITHEFASYVPVEPEETLDWLISELKFTFKTTNIKDALGRIAVLTDDRQVDDALHEMSASSFEILQQTSDRKSAADFVRNAEDRQARYIQRATFDGQIKGAPLGLAEVDAHFFGILPGEVGVMAGYSGAGKSWSLFLAALTGLRQGLNPYLVSLELSREDVEDRLDALAARVSHQELTRGSLPRDEIERLTAAQQETAQLGRHLIVEQPGRNVRTVQSLVANARQAGSDYLIIDQLSFIQGRRDFYRSPQEKITEIMSDIKESVSETSEAKLPVLIAVQFNRNQKQSGSTELYNLAESASIERVADQVFGLNQTPELRINNGMQLFMLKNRRGPLKNWLLNWNLEKMDISVNQELLLDS